MQLTTMDVPHIQALIELLDRIQLRPGMYIGSVTYISVHTYLEGVYTGFRLLGVAVDLTTYREITQARGWDDRNAFGAYPDMKRRGLSEQEMALEELMIHREVWKRQLQAITAKA